MDERTINRVTEHLAGIAEQLGYPLERVIVFGSRVGESYRPDSDVDILIVSPAFEDLDPYKRPKLLFRHWDYDRLPDPEFICLTPGVFEERRQVDPSLVRTAVEEGISVA